MWLKNGVGLSWNRNWTSFFGFWSFDIISSVIEMKSYQFLHFKPFRNCILRFQTHHNPMRFVFWNIFLYYSISITHDRWHSIIVTPFRLKTLHHHVQDVYPNDLFPLTIFLNSESGYYVKFKPIKSLNRYSNY